LRSCSNNTLDDAMRMLWKRCSGGPMTEDDLRTVLKALAGRSLDAELDAWVHGTSPLPVNQLLAQHGVTVQTETAQPAQRLGIRITENHSVLIKMVLRGSWAEQAGLCAGDEWMGITIDDQSWRITKLEDVYFYAGNATHCTAWIARDGRILQLPLQLSLEKAGVKAASHHKTIHPKIETPPSNTISLHITDTASATSWLNGKPT
jgi:predicted metalloprotease with PDZ domain